MPPPFKQAYYYFRHDAEAWMQANRPTWTRQDRTHSISTIWAGSNAIRVHYAGSVGTNPGPRLPTGAQNPIPRRPYTQEETNQAKHDKALPDRGQAPALLAAPHIAPPVAPPVAPPLARVAPPPAPTAPLAHPASSHVDTLPYNFWPQLPWVPKPVFASLDKRSKENKESRVTWLATRPHMNPEDEERSWHGAQVLGAGGYGVAGLWLELDSANNITDRMAIKEASPPPMMWRDPRYWRDRKPQEIKIHELVEERRQADPDACRHLIRSRGSRVFMSQRRYRVYLDYYETDLYSALKRHVENRDYESLPEPVIWYMVKAHSSACMVLQQGISEEDCDPITHLDIQLTNVFLGLKRKREDSEGEKTKDKRAKTALSEEDWSEADWQDLPMIPVLADFGLAFYSLDNRGCPLSDNPVDYLWQSDQTRYAPEHQIQEIREPMIPLGERTDVWGIGSILWYLVAQGIPDEGPLRGDKFDEKKDGSAERTYIPISSHTYDQNKATHNNKTTLNRRMFPKAKDYTSELKNLVRACLNWWQGQRPSLEIVLDEANQRLDEHGARNTLREWQDFADALPERTDSFRIGEGYTQISADNSDTTPSQ